MPDEVDLLVEAWSRERPDLDVSPMAVLSRVSRLARQLERARRQAFAAHGLEAFEFDVLAALRRAGEPYERSPGQLVSATDVTSGTMTNRLDRLEGRGFVRRLPDPRDGRAVRVRLRARGRARVDAALADLLETEHALLQALTPRQRSTMAGLLRRVAATAGGTLPPDPSAPGARNRNHDERDRGDPGDRGDHGNRGEQGRADSADRASGRPRPKRT